MKHVNDKILSVEEVLNEYDKIPEEREYTPEEREVIREFEDFEATVRKNYVLIPVRKNYISHLLDNGYTPTLCYPNTKKSFVKEWQHKFWIEDKNEFWGKCEEFNFDLNYGILTGLAKYNNCMVIDFDIKQFVNFEQQKLIELVNSLTETDYIQTLVRDKKLYIEKSQSNGYHYVVSVNDETERQGKKIVDYFGRKKPNRTILIEHDGFGEVIETRGKGMHFVSYPSYGYQKIHNVLWEINKISTKEYDELETYIINYFLNSSENFSRAKEKNDLVTSQKSNKNELVTSKNFDVENEQLKNYQSIFCRDNKDIQVITDLLNQTNYTPINTDNNFINFIHPNSSKSESNFSLDIEHHCITNFSTNNNDFEVNEAIGTLRASFILWKKLDSNNKKQEQFFEYLRGKYNIVLVRTVAEIYEEAKKSVNVDVDVDETIYTNVFVCDKTGYYQLCICDREISWEQKNLQQIYNMLNVFDAKEQQNIKLDLDQNRKMILSKVKVNYVFCIDKPDQIFKLNFRKNSVDLFVQTTLQEKSKDIELWEWYLSDRFGSYKPFIKQWISSYCYYPEYEASHDIPAMRLSNLILTGERGVGKGSFVNLIRDIFGLNFYFGLDVTKFMGKFDTWKNCRLLFLDELQDEEDYNTQKKVYVKLKTETGTDYIAMEAKNENSIMIKNQVVFIIASNGESPIFTTYKEKPTDPDRNQFFCIDFEYSTEYNNGVISRLQKSFLHYIKTELREIFLNEVVPNFADNQNIRYIVSTPITERQILLFNSNKSKSDFIIETIVKDIFDNNHKWITQEMFKFYKLETGKDIDYIRNLVISKKLVKDKSQSTKIKNELGVLKSYQVYHVIPETLTKMIKLYGIE